MRRPHSLLSTAVAAVLALAATTPGADAQTTARPLPAVSLGSPAMSLSSAGFRPVSLSAGAATPRAASAQPASYNVPYPTDGALVAPSELVAGPAETLDLGSLEVFASARGEADLRSTSGSIEVQRGGLRAQIGQRKGAESAWAVSLANESSFYRFPSGAGLVPGEPKPFNDLYETRAGLQLASRGTDRVTWIGGLELTMAGEDLVDPTDALMVGGLGGVQYRLNDEVDFSFGLAGESRLEDDAWIVPFFGFDWRPTEDLAFTVHGSELRAALDLGESWSVHAGAVYDIRQYRLNDGGPVDGGVFRDEEIRAALGATWQASEAGRLSLEVGQVLWNELTVLDSGGGQVGQSEAEKAPYIGLSLTFGM